MMMPPIPKVKGRTKIADRKPLVFLEIKEHPFGRKYLQLHLKGIKKKND